MASEQATTPKSVSEILPAPLVRSVSAIGLGERTGNLPFLREEEEVKEILKEYFQHLTERTQHHLGYPYNLQFSAGDLKPFLE